jgi:hypothetical protein
MGWFENVLDAWSYKQPKWEYHYKNREHLIIKKTGLTQQQLREVVRLFKEYEILEREGK